MNTQSRNRGCLLGLAVGDAVGTSLEFLSPDTFTPIDNMVGGGPFDLAPGEWTDDTSMALCLAESLIECRAFDPKDQMERYCRWRWEGHLSSNGRCFDIGNTVAAALDRFKRTGQAYSGSQDSRSAGNGSLMRLAPVPLFYRHDPVAAVERAGDSSRTTHGAEECIDACRYFASLLIGALDGASKEELLSPAFESAAGIWQERPLAPKIDDISRGSFVHREPPEIRGTGYVVDCLEAALWAFHRTGSFRDAVLAAANLGDDADTTAAVCGQIAGAFYGEDAIPAEWLERLARRDLILQYADRLKAG